MTTDLVMIWKTEVIEFTKNFNSTKKDQLELFIFITFQHHTVIGNIGDSKLQISELHRFHGVLTLHKLQHIEKQQNSINDNSNNVTTKHCKHCNWIEKLGWELNAFLRIQNSICCTIMVIWYKYNKYAMQMCNQTVLFSTLELGLFSLGLILSTELVKRMNNKYVRYDATANNNSHNSQRYNTNYLTAMISYIVMIVLSSVSYPITIDLNTIESNIGLNLIFCCNRYISNSHYNPTL